MTKVFSKDGLKFGFFLGLGIGAMLLFVTWMYFIARFIQFTEYF